MNGLKSEIEKRAYGHFIARGMTHGRDVEDWLMAEKEILAENGKNKKQAGKKKNTAAVSGKNKNNKKGQASDM